MSGIPSFQRIDYSIRTNKNIERKLVFEMLRRLREPLELSKYRYLGFGSLWFVDFVLAHRSLGINVMWSIEHAESAPRAEFNKPYDCIEIRPGDCSSVLGSLNETQWTVRTLAWLDYDGRFNGDAMSDCQTFLTKAAAGSVIVVSVNAHRNNYRVSQPEFKSSVDILREMLGDCVPANVPPSGRRDLDLEEFPALLEQSLLAYMASTVRDCGRATEGYQDRFVPLFALQHRDNAPMVTIGGMICSWRQVPMLEAALKTNPDALFAGNSAVRDTLDLVPITMKEKLILDRLLPSDEASFEAKFSAAGIQLAIEQAEKYRRLYTHYPVFTESLV